MKIIVLIDRWFLGQAVFSIKSGLLEQVHVWRPAILPPDQNRSPSKTIYTSARCTILPSKTDLQNWSTSWTRPQRLLPSMRVDTWRETTSESHIWDNILIVMNTGATFEQFAKTSLSLFGVFCYITINVSHPFFCRL